MNNLRSFFGKAKEKIGDKIWDWGNFKSTENFPVSKNLLDWVIGQDHAMEECKLCLDEWMHKLKGLKKRKWWRLWAKPKLEKPCGKDQLSPAPSLFLLGDAGTGKSLIGRALASHLTFLCKKFKIPLYDIICWKNEVIPSEPRISMVPSPQGKEIVNKLRKKSLKKNRFSKWSFRLLQGGMIGFGLIMIGFVLYHLINNWMFPNPIVYYTDYGVSLIPKIPDNYTMSFAKYIEEQGLLTFGEYWSGNGGFLNYFINGLVTNAQILYLGIASLSMGAMLFIFKHIIGRFGGTKKGIGGAESLDSPKLIVDNSGGKAPFIDATGHGSSQLFGSIAWDPLQTGGLGTPEHQRVSAGEVHRAFMGILYIDEIKNLSPREAVTLLTVLEDGQLPIALRSHGSVSGDTAAMSVATEPVPCLNFLVAAGNLDSVPLIHFALMDRIQGYGKVVYMNNDMPNTVKNRRKYIQFIAQEIQRFDLLPFSREACIEIIEESRRKSGKNNKLSCLFRPMISILKTSSILALNEGLGIVESKHVKEAINEHCKTIEEQVLDRFVSDSNEYKIVNPNANSMVGQIYGLAVTLAPTSTAKIGTVLPIRSSMLKLKKGSRGSFVVTGVSQTEGSWINNSTLKVAHVISQLWKISTPLKIHIDFAQAINIDGPSAGVAMILTLLSILENKPIKQDVAVTGEINIAIPLKENKKRWKPNEVIVTPVGGIRDKILAAQKMGFKKVLIPKLNAEKNIRESDYTIKIVGCTTLADYIKEIFDGKST